MQLLLSSRFYYIRLTCFCVSTMNTWRKPRTDLRDDEMAFFRYGKRRSPDVRMRLTSHAGLRIMSGNLLVVIVEVDALNFGVEELQKVLNDVIVFCNNHLLLSHHNKLVFCLCHQVESVILYSSVDEAQDDGNDHEQSVTEVLPTRIKRMFSDLVELRPTQVSSSPLLAGALAKSLCCIHRYHREKSSGEAINSRILVVKCCPDSSNQYMTTLSAIFAAQKEKIVIDACTLRVQSGYMQQAADITGGLYYTVEQLDQLLQHLVWMYLPHPACRGQMVMPLISTIDYRAACFCHHNMVDIGYVCSVCLSIFCQFNPICSTCK
ncbi:general transcription factor IIH subunit 3-like isoform X3 [Dysidea avara]|uniref:general transcription factor IIH subunit 3-like isoform X3 n=1 Tax=Dysidea avara TaxID=196820 RepID=UPI00332C9CD9